MGLPTIFLIALGLSADAFAVSVSSGMAMRGPRYGDALKLGLSFGLFQAVMPLIGWVAGLSLRAFITGVDHWIAFGLLGFIGCKMIYEALRGDSHEVKADAICPSLLLFLSVATSIDALAVGITFSFLAAPIALPIAIIGFTTFALSFVGVFLGERCGRLFEKKAEIVGGLILITIGVKILIEHLSEAAPALL